MKMKTSTGRKIRYGGTSLAMTALIIAIVIIGIVLLTKYMLKDVDKWFKNPEKATEKEIEEAKLEI